MTHPAYEQPSLLASDEGISSPVLLPTERQLPNDVVYAQDVLFEAETTDAVSEDVIEGQTDLPVEPDTVSEVTPAADSIVMKPQIAKPGVSVRLDERAEPLIKALENLNDANQENGFVKVGSGPKYPGYWQDADRRKRYRELVKEYGDALPFEVDQAAQRRDAAENAAKANLYAASGREALIGAGFAVSEVDRITHEMWLDFGDKYGVGRAKASKRNPAIQELKESQATQAKIARIITEELAQQDSDD